VKITDIRVHPMGMPAERVRWTAQEITRRVELTLVEVRTDAGRRSRHCGRERSP
jgi:hypothetical protein